jgi:hypothetical protein
MPDVSTKSAAVQAMEADWALMDDLMGGTTAMRDAGTVRMPQWPLEDEKAYAARLATATLFPAFSETVASMAGRVFGKPLVIGDDVPAEIQDRVLPNVDMAGRNLHAFASDVFELAMAHGLSFILVDHPRVEGAKTQADEQALGVRPYWVHIGAQQVLGWRTELTNGRHRLTQFRYQEVICEPDGEFGAVDVEQIRVLEPGRCRLYRRVNGEWTMTDDIVITVPEIPIVTVYTGRTGFMTAKPPLLELAHLNVKHWQSQSDQDTILHTARVPLLLRKGAEPQLDPETGKPMPMQISGSLIDVPESGDMKYVEHTGAAIEAGHKSLEELKEQMKLAGAKLLTATVLSLSESQAEDEQSKEVSQLAAMAEKLTDALDQALVFTAQWMNIPGEAGHTEIGADLTLGPVSVQGVETMTKIEGRSVSAESVFDAAKRAGLVPSDRTWEDEQGRMSATPPAPPVRPVVVE